MSAPRQSSPLAAALEVPCPILQSLRDASDIKAQGASSDKVSRMDTIQEESTEPEDEHCQACQHSPSAAGEETQGDGTNQNNQSEAISEYVVKIREAIKLQGQHLQSEEAKEHEHESEKLDFHMKVGGKRRRTSLLSGVRERGRNVVCDIKSQSKRLSIVIPIRKAGNSGFVEVKSEEQKHTEGKKRVSILGSKQRRISAIVALMPTKSPGQSNEMPKIKSKTHTSTYSSKTGSCPDTKDAAFLGKSNGSRDGGDNGDDGDDGDDGYSDDDSEVVGLLSVRRSVSSRSESFHASHFYTPMVPSGSWRHYEYRLRRSRIRHSIAFSREMASKSLRRIRYNVSNSLNARRKHGGWSRLEN